MSLSLLHHSPFTPFNPFKLLNPLTPILNGNQNQNEDENQNENKNKNHLNKSTFKPLKCINIKHINVLKFQRNNYINNLNH